MTLVANFEIFNIVLILHLPSGKVITIVVEKFSTSEIISKKVMGGGEEGKAPVP